MKKDIRIPWITLLLGATVGASHIFGSVAFELLVWREDWFEVGEIWRVFTGHFVHASGSHLVWDLGAFLILGSFVELDSRRRLLVLLGTTVLLTDLALRLSGRFEVYCGLSGMDIALFTAAACQVVRQGRKMGDPLLKWLGAGGLVLVFWKVGFELYSGSTVFVSALERGYSVAVEAHLAGLAAGLIGTIFSGFLTTYQLVGFKDRHVTTTST